MLSIAGAGWLQDSVKPWRVAWTKGQSCSHLADVLGDGPATPLAGDPRQACVANRIDLVVAPKLTGFDLVPVVTPHGVHLDDVEAVTAAVGDGPHSDLAAAVATRLAVRLGIPGELATLYRTQDGRAAALGRLERIGRLQPLLGRRALEAPAVSALVDTLTPSTLLLLGAPGGSWLQRQFFGTGHRLTVTAPGGAIVVRSAPRRCFHEADDVAGSAAAPQLSVAEALRLFSDTVIPVAEVGRLVGVARRARMRTAPGGTTVGDIMEPPVAVTATEDLEAAEDLFDFLDGGPVPVVDGSGLLVGTIAPSPHG